MKPHPTPAGKLGPRLVWFAALYVGGVLATLALALILRLVLGP